MAKLSPRSIGAKIKLARLELGLTQTEFGDKIGLTSVMISRYESGKSSPVRQIEAIATTLGKSQDYFFGSDDKDELYKDIKELVRLLKDRAIDSSWPFKPDVPLLDYDDLQELLHKDFEELDIEKVPRIDTNSSILKKDPQSYAVKVSTNFAKSVFPKSTILIVSPNVEAKKSDFVLRYGKAGLVVGKKSTTRGKMLGVVVQTTSEL